MEDAVRRDPSDAQAWAQLASLERSLNDTRDLLSTARRVLVLDPTGVLARQLLRDAYRVSAPPGDSATATGTPLAGG